VLRQSLRLKGVTIYYIYNVFLTLFSLFLLPLLPFYLLKSNKRGLRRLAFFQPSGPVDVLIHAVSVGEVKAMRAFINYLRTERPELRIGISTTTDTGYKTASDVYVGVPVYLFPLDFYGACSRFFKKLNPSLVVLAELELWPNFLRVCEKNNCEVVVVNGRITEKSLSGYLKIGRWLPRFGNIRFFCVQNKTYYERFLKLGVSDEKIEIAGNLKYDSLDFSEVLPGDPWRRWSEQHSFFLLASTHAPEEKRILKSLNFSLNESVRLLIAPRHPQRCEKLLIELREAFPEYSFGLWSRERHKSSLSVQVLIIDALGQLEDIYRVSKGAFIGGTLIEHGGQNLLEAAVANCPICLGPSVYNFESEVALLESKRGLVRCKDAEDVIECFSLWLRDSEGALEIANRAYSALESRRGAVKNTYNLLANLKLNTLK
jgi:3-deoxy-D-manno-octulosonic-acid transferase